MSFQIFQRTIVDASGNIQPGASVSVRDESTGELAEIYSDRLGGSIKGNPFTADAQGFVSFFAGTGEYRVTATTPSGAVATWSFVQFVNDEQFIRAPESSIDPLPSVSDRAGKALAFDASGNPVPLAVGGTEDPSLRADLAQPTGSALVGFQQSGGVVRSTEQKLQEFSSVKDAGAIGDGVTNDTAAFVASPGGIIPAGTYFVNGTLNPGAVYDTTGPVDIVSSDGSGVRFNSSKFEQRWGVDRRPNYLDAVKFNSGDLWQHKGRVWEASRAFEGQVVNWIQYRSLATKYNSTPLVQCSLKKVVAGYTGPCVQVRNVATGTFFDVGFLPDGSFDFDTLRNNLLSTTGRVSIFYDQSGNGNHLTQVVNDNQPKIEPYPDETGMPRIILEDALIYNGVATPPQGFDIPATVVATSTNVYIGALVKCPHAHRILPFATLTGASSVALGSGVLGFVGQIRGYVNNVVYSLTTEVPSLHPEWVSIVSAADSIRVSIGDRQLSFPQTAAPVALTGGNVGLQGTLFGTSNGRFSLYALMVDTGVAGNFTKGVYSAAAIEYNLFPQRRGVVVFDGDSITEGAFGEAFRSWPSVIASEYSLDSWAHYNVAVSGGTILSQIDRLPWWGAQVAQKGGPKVIIMAGGSNALQSGNTAASLFANMQTYVALAATYGFKVIPATILPRGNIVGAAEVERIAYNALLRSQYKTTLGAPALLDFARERTMGNSANLVGTTYYADGTHPTPFGLTILAGFASDLLNRYMANMIH